MNSKVNIPFSVQYTISFSGRTKSDGVRTVTATIIRDQMIELLEKMLGSGYIGEYTITAMLNNIETAKKVIKRSKRK